MRLKYLSLLIVLIIVIASILIAILSNIISHENEFNPDDVEGKEDRQSARSQMASKVMGDKPDHLMWFIQISDLHLSIFHDQKRITDLYDFTNQTIDAIKPTVVLASGDLADGKAIDAMGSNQYVQEWEHYKTVLDTSGVQSKTIWLDIRGNHDNFNVPGVDHERSYYHKYSVQGRKHLRSYMYKIQKGPEQYSFIAVDACLDPGPRRPFNFIGSITPEQYQLLQKFEQDSTNDENVVDTVWFGHYPTSCVISPEPGFRYLMKNSVYMCGHLHTLGGMVPEMYTLHKSGLLELELGDWKDNRIYRVAAFDHGLFSFVDVIHRKWPIILITNPKHALYVLPRKDNLEQIKQSTHVRILVFSSHPLELVQVRFGDSLEWKRCQNVEGPLFVAEWNPSLYSEGVQQIHVYAKDQNGQVAEVSQPFSLDGTRLKFNLLPRIALMTDAHRVFFGIFVFLVLISVLPLVALRWLHYLIKANHIDKNLVQDILQSNFVRKLWVMATINKLYYPIIVYPLYITIGPWFVGEVIEGHMGAAFSWGTYVHGKVLPTSFTYFYGIAQLFWFHLPFVLLLSFCVDSRFRTVCLEGGSCSRRTFYKKHVPCGCILLVQALFAFYFWQAYGTVATILGPFRTWSVIMGCYLWYSSAKLSVQDFSEARAIWKTHPLILQNGESAHVL